MVRCPEMSGKACTHTGDGGTPTKHSVPVGRSDCRYIPQSWSAFAVFKIKSMDPATSFIALDSRLLTKLCAPSARASCSLSAEVEKGRDFRAEYASKLDGNVSQSTDSNNANPRRGVDVMDAERIIDSDAPAEQWRRLFAVKAVGNRNYEACIGTNAFGVTAVAMNTCSFGIGAKVLQAPHAPFALTAGIRLPPETDSLAYLERSCLTAHGSNSPDNLVARYERKMADAPIVGDKVKIAVADATVSNGDLNLLRTQLSWLIVEGQ